MTRDGVDSWREWGQRRHDLESIPGKGVFPLNYPWRLTHISFNPLIHSRKISLEDGVQNSEMYSNLPEVTQLISSRVRIETQVSQAPEPMLLTRLLSCLCPWLEAHMGADAAA